jgi:hypothetical protein
MSFIRELVEGLRVLLTDELGTTPAGTRTIYVSPGTQDVNATGLKCIIDRNPVQFNRNTTKVTGGTYFPDHYKVSLVNQVQDKNNNVAAQKMTDAIRKIESNYVVSRLLYTSPDDEIYEKAIIYIFHPEINKE